MGGLFELLEKIEAKPAMYLGTASIADLRMFIIGYRFARFELGIATTEAESDFYKNFQPWLQKRLHVRTTHSWDKTIQFKCIDETAAFRYFFQLLEEFHQRDKSQDIDPILLDEELEATEKIA